MTRTAVLFASLLLLAGCDRFSLKTEDGKRHYTSGDVVTVYASYRGQRADETALSPGWIEWSAGKVGDLGTGPELMTSLLPPGTHRIRATFMSPTGKVLAKDSLRITVENQAPDAEITSVQFAQGDVLFLTGAAPDHEDGHVKPSKMVWYVDGKQVGKGERVTVYGVGPGRHEINLHATDSNRMKTGVMQIAHAPEAAGNAPSVHASTPAGDAAPGTTGGLLGGLKPAQ